MRIPPLAQAARNGHVEVVREMVAEHHTGHGKEEHHVHTKQHTHRAEVDGASVNGSTALMYIRIPGSQL